MIRSGRGARGHPYRVPVNNKNTFSGPKSFAARNASTAYRFGSAVCCLCSVTLTYRNVLAPSFFFAPVCSLWIHSSSPPALGRQLFRAVIHPDLDRGLGDTRPPPRAPSRFCGTRTTSVPHPVHAEVPPDGETGQIGGLTGSDPVVKPS